MFFVGKLCTREQSLFFALHVYVYYDKQTETQYISTINQGCTTSICEEFCTKCLEKPMFISNRYKTIFPRQQYMIKYARIKLKSLQHIKPLTYSTLQDHESQMKHINLFSKLIFNALQFSFCHFQSDSR